ncbi:MAG: HAMP domain-containing histidine kinase [Roseburia sp.]|nr:HAMP domain-containing histidine kinase [Roseburia sp.]
MYKRLHHHLTIIFSAITGSILLVMSLFYLCSYEKDVTENHFLSFSQKASSVISNLEQQEKFSSQWQVSTAANNNFLLAFYDKETLLQSCVLILSDEDQQLAKNALEYGCSLFPMLETYAGYIPFHREFLYKASGHPDFYVSAVKLPRNSGSLTGVILYDTTPLHSQIARQRLRFAILNGIGILCLVLFSWFYTGRLVRPIQTAHEKQNAFIAAAAHELRTPLAVILSAVSASGKANPKEKETFLRTIGTESRRMSLLVNDMLTLSRADNQNFLLNLTQAELDTLLLETSEAFEPLARDCNVHLEVTLPEQGIPKCTCDIDRIRQVLEILISNALSYGKKGGTVTLSLKEKSSHFLIAVADRGPGIPDKDKPCIFDRFYRGDSSRTTKDHFGLGLCIAKEIMDAHQGKIQAKDTPGGGATFLLELKKFR